MNNNENETIPASGTFREFGLKPQIDKVLSAQGFKTPTDIQRKAIPLLMSASRVDFHGQAQTGTGKTLAFGLPLLHRIDISKKTTQAIIIAPTRELAVQICDSLQPFASAVGVTMDPVYGGVSMETQLRRLRRGVHVVVGTPGRVNDHIRRGSLSLDQVKTLVLDEADIMLDMGFKEDIDFILEKLPEDREIWLFSATVKGGIYAILKTHMQNTQSIRVNKEEIATHTTKHYFAVVPHHSRTKALCRFIECSPDFYGFIFCQTKLLTAQVADQLIAYGYRVGALHGDLSQSQRNLIIKKFRAKEITIVVATDVAARGIDVAHLTHVINYSLPEDQESYVHRSGRTGRAGREGIAITFISKPEVRYVRLMQRKFNLSIDPINVPDRDALLAARTGEIHTYITTARQKKSDADLPHTACAEIIGALSDEECRRVLSVMLYEKFLKSIDDGENFGATQALEEGHSERNSYESQAHGEVSINVGLDDNVQREDITAILELKEVPLDQVLKVRVLKRCTFIHVAPSVVDACVAALHNTIIGGRTVRAVRMNQQQQQRDGFRRDGYRSDRSGGFGGRRHGGSSGPRRESSYGDTEYGERSEGGYRGGRGGDRSSVRVYRPDGADRTSNRGRKY